jgi:CubicO group peptidase (beta-lactamase class C family)
MTRVVACSIAGAAAALIALSAACVPTTSAVTSTAAASPPSNDPDVRVHNVENGLIITTADDDTTRSTLADQMKELHVPGVQIAVVDHYDIAWTRSYGVLDSETHAPVKMNSIFRACSLSKVLAALATLKLVEDGEIALDEDVNQRLTSWTVPANDFPDKPTVRRILNHTAGFNVHGFGRGYPRGAPLPSLIDILSGKPPAVNEPIQVTYDPGSKFDYSGGGTTVLEQLLIDVKKETYQDLLQATVLGRLGMTSSTFEEPLGAIWIDRAAHGHDDRGMVFGGWDRAYPMRAAAGLWTTATDMAKVLIEMEKASMGTSNMIISQATIKDVMMHEETPTEVDQRIGSPPKENPQSGHGPRIPKESDAHAGLGIFLETIRGHVAIVHEGAESGYAAYFAGYPDLGVGAVILTNGDDGLTLAYEIARAIANEYRWP